jgi:hypothetical protein
VETPHIRNVEQYERFVAEAVSGSLVLLELGVGFNTPGIIRFPFETITAKYPYTSLVRINLSNAEISGEITDKAIGIKADVGRALHDL